MGEHKAESTANAGLTSTEKRILLTLDSEKGRAWDPRNLAEKTGINEDAVMQTAFMLAQKGLCGIKEEKKVFYHLTEEGEYYAEKGLPEKKALEFLREKKRVSFDELRNEFLAEANIATTWLLRKGYARIEEEEDGKVLTPTGNTSWLPPEVPKDRYPNVDIHEEIVRIIPKEGEIEESIVRRRLKDKFPEIKDITPGYHVVGDLLKKRKWLEEDTRAEWKIAITEAGHEVVSRGISVEEELTQLTPELIRTGSWKGRKFKRYDVNLPSKEEFPAKIHPYQRILDRMRKIFTEMGFEEIKGDLIQSAFWNFDALFVPQDHPAREMQDTFYLGVRKPLDVGEEVIRNVKEMHEHGGSLNSTGWGGEWKRELSEELLLRTHTTAVTLWYLASHPEPPVKVFCIDRVYRRETIDPTHLPEFDQLEGIVMDKGVTFSNLLGLLATFYKKMGFPSIRFRPSYFPYTEPSVEVEVYMPEHGWLELGGAGIFREEVTNPVGVKYPVLAWGLGIGRLAMLSLGLTDIRDLYQSDIDWLRKSRIFR
ncbi:MAG: phenylalanine--tRNA ligase subunit alpha [Methanophagales archaeon]|nr:phenylalanine--tRNA ligase subunit alpha [Methanophagales archaeon]